MRTASNRAPQRRRFLRPSSTGGKSHAIEGDLWPRLGRFFRCESRCNDQSICRRQLRALRTRRNRCRALWRSRRMVGPGRGRYGRGHLPAVGSILVFKRTGHMRSGHVALVARVVSSREILVDHANWHRGTVSRGMSVIDTSRDQDWTQVAVIDLPSGKHGRSGPTFGFIYPGAGRHEIVETRDTRSPDSSHRVHSVSTAATRGELAQPSAN
jgi:surface antigen